MKACVFAPDRGTDLFYDLYKLVGYEKAWKIMGTINNPQFMQDFKDTLTLDSEGIPTYSSLISNPYVLDIMGKHNVRNAIQLLFSEVENTRANYKAALDKAREFNLTSEHRKNYTAVVREEGDQIKVTILPRTDKAVMEFRNLYATSTLNTDLANILSPLGVTEENLTKAELDAGRAGVIDFSKARDMAKGSVSMIRVANNREGFEALSEEYTHLIVELLRDNPLLKRSLEYLSKNPELLLQILGNEFADTMKFHDNNVLYAAEEALGKIMQEHFKQLYGVLSALLNRLRDFIYKQYLNINEDDILKALAQADSLFALLAKDILSGKTELDKSKLRERQLQLNSLADRMLRNIDVLKDAKTIEIKREKLMQNHLPGVENYAITILDRGISRGNPNDHLEAIYKYTLNGVKALLNCAEDLAALDMADAQETFKLLRRIKYTIDSYGKWIWNVNKILSEENTLSLTEFEIDVDENGNQIYIALDPDVVSMLANPVSITTSTGQLIFVEISPVIKELNALVKSLGSDYDRVSKLAFAEFIKPIIGEKVVFNIGKRAGTEVSVKELLESADSDISLMEVYLDNMGTSTDVLTQVFDEIVKDLNRKAIHATIREIQAITRMKMEALKKGLTEFSWMFETYEDGALTGDYIGKVNFNLYQRNLENKLKELKEKYGENPTGQDKADYDAELNAWHIENSIRLPDGTYECNLNKYKNENFERLTDVLKEFLTEYLDFKERLEEEYPEKQRYREKAILIRKSNSERALKALANPSKIFEFLKLRLEEDFLERVDDDLLYGQRTGLLDLSGNEYRTVPALYTHRLENPNDLSLDIFGTLMSYAAATWRFNALTECVDAVEVGLEIVKNRDIKESLGDENLVEVLYYKGEEFVQLILKQKGDSNAYRKLRELIDAQVYLRTTKNTGTFKVFNKKVSKNKLASAVLKISTNAQLGFNLLANTASLAQGICMLNIEAVAGEYFNAKELAKADAIYTKLLMGYFSDIGSATPLSKLYLFDQAINFKGDFFKDMKEADQRKLIQRILGKHLLFIGLGAGDHWLYNRAAIAMCLRIKVNVPGEGEMSLWDALRVENAFSDNDKIKKLTLPVGTTSVKTGKEIDMLKIGALILKVNQDCFGRYNEEDSNAANRYIAGKFVMHYRKFIKPLWDKRFAGSRMNLMMEEFDKETEGFYRTAYNVLTDLVLRSKTWGEIQDGLTDHLKKNLKRTVVDLLLYFSVALLAAFWELPDDDEDSCYPAKLANYLSRRLKNELGMMTPSLDMPRQWGLTVQSLSASVSTMIDLCNVAGCLLWPGTWVSEDIQTGPYKGFNQLLKALYLAPLPYISYYRNLDKSFNRVKEAADYYLRTR